MPSIRTIVKKAEWIFNTHAIDPRRRRCICGTLADGVIHIILRCAVSDGLVGTTPGVRLHRGFWLEGSYTRRLLVANHTAISTNVMKNKHKIPVMRVLLVILKSVFEESDIGYNTHFCIIFHHVCRIRNMEIAGSITAFSDMVTNNSVILFYTKIIMYKRLQC